MTASSPPWSPTLRRMLPVLAGAGGLIALHQFLDLQAALTGADLATPAGRMRLVNAAAGRLPAFVVADVMVILVVAGLAVRRGLLPLALLHFGVGASALLVMPEYLSDAAALVPSVEAPEEVPYRILVLRITLLLVALGAAGIVAGLKLRAMLREGVSPEGRSG